MLDQNDRAFPVVQPGILLLRCKLINKSCFSNEASSSIVLCYDLPVMIFVDVADPSLPSLADSSSDTHLCNICTCKYWCLCICSNSKATSTQTSPIHMPHHTRINTQQTKQTRTITKSMTSLTNLRSLNNWHPLHNLTSSHCKR